jgi:hypothetical protein
MRFRQFALLSLLLTNPVFAEDTSQKVQIVLFGGSNNLRVHGKQIRVIKASVQTADAHSFESYTSFVTANDQGGDWQHILVSNPDDDAESFRSAESADSNVQSIAMYQERNELFAVQARKTRLLPHDLYLKKAKVVFTEYRFNDDIDYPRFVRERTTESVATYLNASDAITNEFFDH